MRRLLIEAATMLGQRMAAAEETARRPPEETGGDAAAWELSGLLTVANYPCGLAARCV